MNKTKLAEIDQKWNPTRKFKPGDKAWLNATDGLKKLNPYVGKECEIIDFIHIPGNKGFHTHIMGNKYKVRFEDGAEFDVRSANLSNSLVRKF